MNKRNSQNLIYAAIFLIISVNSMIKEEKITLIVSLIMAAIFFVIYNVFAVAEGKYKFLLKGKN